MGCVAARRLCAGRTVGSGRRCRSKPEREPRMLVDTRQPPRFREDPEPNIEGRSASFQNLSSVYLSVPVAVAHDLLLGSI